ncbi:hypothetical protein ACFLSU_00950 [Bacteroidota bacterium]
MKFIRRLLRNTHPTTKPEYLEDPIALKTSWFPINSGGANFCTHIASKKDSKVVFEKTIMYSFFPWVFIVMAGFIIVKIIQDKTYQNIDDNFIWTSVLSIVVLLIGIFLLFILKKRIVFDKSTGYYTRGRKNQIYLLLLLKKVKTAQNYLIFMHYKLFLNILAEKKRVIIVMS